MNQTDEYRIRCALPSWYDRFRKISLKSRIIPLSLDFIDYLHADGIFTPLDPDGNDAGPVYLQSTHSDDEDDALSSTSSGSEQDQDINSNGKMQTRYSFPELFDEMRKTIADLGGVVFPKLDWSSPRDACWISPTSTLKCTAPEDICLLLKASDFIAHDLTVLKDPRTYRYHLILREWFDIHPAMEFRCFVAHGQFIAISQRDYRHYYAFLVEHRDEIRHHIQEFWKDHLKDGFSESEYVFDVYLTRQDTAQHEGHFVRKVWLIDINPYADETDALLFQWDEIREMSDIQESSFPELRLIQSEMHAQEYGSAVPSFSSSMLPQEATMLAQGLSLMDLASNAAPNK